MKENFVPFEQALNLKEIRFDEECMSFYNQSGSLNLSRIDSFDWVIRNSNYRVVKLKYVSAPLWDQAFDWFREKHNLDGLIKPNKGIATYSFSINSISKLENQIFFNHQHSGYKKYNSYQEARQACLEKLIEIVENKKQ